MTFTEHEYQLVDEDGCIVCEVKSHDTRLSYEDYAARYIVPLCHELSGGDDGERVYWTEKYPKQWD